MPVHVGRAYPHLAFGNFVHPPTIMVRREVLEGTGLFDESLRWTSDWEWIARLSRLGPFVHVARALLDYRLSKLQMSSSGTDGAQALEFVSAGQKIWSADPSLARTEPARLRRCRREFYLGAAYGLSERHKLKAARLLVQAVWNGALGLATARTALRILLPPGLASWIRELRRRARADT